MKVATPFKRTYYMGEAINKSKFLFQPYDI